MPGLWSRLARRADAPKEQKSAPQSLLALTGSGEPSWSRRGFVSLAGEGFVRNPVVHRCVRLIAEAANSVPLVVEEDGRRVSEHPALALLRRPNPRQSGGELLEAVYAFLQTAGNAYLEAVLVEGEPRGLYCLRPDRMRVVAGKDGWPSAYAYSAGGGTRTLSQEPNPMPKVLHLALFHPLDDHYGLAPLEAAQTSMDIHNAAARWNKALLDNAARPSGALVFDARDGERLTEGQFEALKAELAEAHSGAANAGRPLVLEGGLDWKAMSMSPSDMDFIAGKHAAAREIALAFGVPPQLLGIPGDATYANYREANAAFWRGTVVPLVRKTAGALTGWLGGRFEGVEITPDLEAVPALQPERDALWARLNTASFLTDEERRRMAGVGA